MTLGLAGSIVSLTSLTLASEQIFAQTLHLQRHV